MRAALLAVLCLFGLDGKAQEAEPSQAQGATTPASTDKNAPPVPVVTELDAVRVVGVRPAEDPFAFRNPVEVEGTVFGRHWDEPPSLEEVGMRGGYVQIAINRGLELTAEGIRKLPGWRLQVQGAQARPPPLDTAQQARAARLREAEGVSP